MSKLGDDRTLLGQGLENTLREIARMAALCDVRLLNPGAVERVLGNDASVCGRDNREAFDKMRGLLMMHYAIRGRAIEALGPEEAQAIVENVVVDLRKVWRDSAS
jgi:hypothetical protein